MLDGLTLNQGDGEVILEDSDLATIKYAEVFRARMSLRLHYTGRRDQSRDGDWPTPIHSFRLEGGSSAISGTAHLWGFQGR